MAQLLDDLMALAGVVPSDITGELLAGAANGETLLVEQVANLADHEDVMALVIAAVAPPLDRAELGEFLFPVAQDVGFDPTELADFTDGEIAFAGDRR